MTASALLLADLRQRGFRLSVVGDAIKIAPSSALTADLRAAIKANTPVLIDLLAPIAVGDLVRVVDGDGYALDHPPATVCTIASSTFDPDRWALLATGWWRPLRSLRKVEPTALVDATRPRPKRSPGDSLAVHPEAAPAESSGLAWCQAILRPSGAAR